MQTEKMELIVRHQLQVVLEEVFGLKLIPWMETEASSPMVDMEEVALT